MKYVKKIKLPKHHDFRSNFSNKSRQNSGIYQCSILFLLHSHSVVFSRLCFFLYQLYATAQTHTDIKKATWKVKIKRKNERKGLREEVWLMWFLLKLVFASFYYFSLFSSLYSSSLHKVGRLQPVSLALLQNNNNNAKVKWLK